MEKLLKRRAISQACMNIKDVISFLKIRVISHLNGLVLVDA